MLTRKQLRELNGVDLPLHIIEQDYIQSIFLGLLYQKEDDLVFKGGTFLKHAHGLDRYSEDLDFTLKHDKVIKGIFQGPVSKMDSFGIEAELKKIEEDDLSFTAKLRYMGPLYDGTERSVGSIAIDVSKRKDIFKDPEWTRLFFEYPGSRVVNVLGLDKVELLSEKLRALNTRNKGRDLYDVWFLLKQGVEIDPLLFKKKMEIMDQPPKINIIISKKDWSSDLSTLLVNPPNYEMVRTEVIDILTDIGLDQDDLAHEA